MVRNWDLLKGRHFLKLLDYTPEEIEYLLDLAADLKERKKKGIRVDYLVSKNIVLIFEKTSTRTRCSFETAAHDLGMGCTYLDPSASQIGKKESIADTARVLGRMYEGIEYRGFEQERVETLAKYAGVPVWNGLTNEFHPTQMLADLLTINREKGHFDNLVVGMCGDLKFGRTVHSLIAALSRHANIRFVLISPEELRVPGYIREDVLKANGVEYVEVATDFTKTRDYGFGTPRITMGDCSNRELGKFTAYVYDSCDTYVAIYVGDKMMVLNRETAEETKLLYEELSEKIGR